MNPVYDVILEKAGPYLDTRQNDVHIALSYDFAKRLLHFYPDGDADVVLPAILLHDVGWKMVPEDEQLNAFGPNMNNKELQRLHEVEGARIAEEILKSVEYDSEKVREILSIIDGHDTRRKAFSLNDGIVKDADKLWRYTPVGVEVDHSRFNFGRDEHMTRLEGFIDKWFFTDEAKAMARAALSESRMARPALRSPR